MISDDVKFEDEHIRIVGFKHDHRIKKAVPKADPVLEYGGNPHQYHIMYQLKPPQGQANNMKFFHVHQVSFARLPGEIIMLDNYRFGSGQLLY